MILAGGTGRRIGSEKAFLEFFGSTMIERTEEIVSEVVNIFMNATVNNSPIPSSEAATSACCKVP